jgi:hypothetical protein
MVLVVDMVHSPVVVWVVRAMVTTGRPVDRFRGALVATAGQRTVRTDQEQLEALMVAEMAVAQT